jgi:CheY-like chemotaxis protein
MNAPHAESSAPLILVVDDDKTAVQIIGSLLVKQGYQVETAFSGSEGVSKAAECKPDLILMDINMPGMDGYEATGKIKAIDELRQIPVIFLSGRPPEKDLGEAFAAGGTSYLRKPITGQQLAQVVAMVLESVREGR